jgi:hypothetical protein
MENSELFKLKLQDFGRGAISALFAGFLLSVVSVVQQSGFDAFGTDWGQVLNVALSAAVSAFVGYLSKNFLSDSDGKFLGRI